MAEAILALSDRVTADSPRDAPPPQALALHFPGGVIGLQSTLSIGADGTNQVVLEPRRSHAPCKSACSRSEIARQRSVTSVWLRTAVNA